MSRPRFFLAPLSSSLAAMALLSACGGASSSTPAAATPATATAAEPALPALDPPPRAWPELTHDERRSHMVSAVLPAMEARFLRYDAERFDDFSCATCHGPGAADGSYAMPSAALPPIYRTGTIGQEEMVAAQADDCRFMFQEVVPAMRTLLGAAEYDPRAETGLSCFTCHPHTSDDDPRNAPAAP